jgi:hypothetical protein
MRSMDMEYGFVPPRDGKTLQIQGGRVGCPSRGDVGIEVCLACRHLRGITGAGHGVVVCDVHADLMLPYDRRTPADGVRRSGR